MKITLGWLWDFVDLGVLGFRSGDSAPMPTDARVRRLVDELNELGMVVEGVEFVPASLAGVVVAQVREIETIEGADRVRLTRVDVGDGRLRDVVCGAYNFEVGDVVALATPGTTLPTGATIGERRLFGITSEGMLCSPVEVGVASEAGGLYLLPQDLPLGSDFGEVTGIVDEIVIDLAIEANRPDANCVLGVARDLAARLGVELTLPALVTFARTDALGVPSLVRAPEGCDRLLLAELKGISKAYLAPLYQRRLFLTGTRSISPVVDATNYVLAELGQPTHPYDRGAVSGGAIGVRFATPGEALVTLDGRSRSLTGEDLVITDGSDRAIGLAGIMGGQTSEVTSETSEILLEVAHFVPSVIARSSKRLGLRSEASARFERGVDPGIGEIAIARICELAGLDAPSAISELTPPLVELDPVVVRPSRIAQLLGLEPEDKRLAAILQSSGPLGRAGFGFVVEGDSVVVSVPSFRPDVIGEVDVIEEVARHLGYRTLPRKMLRAPGVGALTETQRLLRALRVLLRDEGIHEAWSVTMVSPEEHRDSGGIGGALRIANPLTPEESLLRQTILAGLLRGLRFNLARRVPQIRLFEIGPVFGENPDLAAQLPREEQRLAVLVQGSDNGLVAIANIVETLLRLGGLEGSTTFVRYSEIQGTAGWWPTLHPERSFALVDADGTILGVVGELAPSAIPSELEHLTSSRFGYLEWSLECFAYGLSPRYRVSSSFGSRDLDLSFLVPREVLAATVLSMVRAIAGELASDSSLFDRYLPSESALEQSLGVRLRLESSGGVVTDEMVAELIDRIEAGVVGIPARLRRLDQL
ncbi:MAG: phenylalanine--tRNA ligase subunit beta [Ferrimicrobium sp.]